MLVKTESMDSDSPPVRRRTVLAALAVGAAGCATDETPPATPTTPSEPVAVTVPAPDAPAAAAIAGGDTPNDRLSITVAEHRLDAAGTLSGTGGPVGIDGPFPAHLFWCPPDGVDAEAWFAAGSLGRSERETGAGRIYLNTESDRVSTWLLAHERGHTLGLRHSDDGLMDYRAPDLDRPGIAAATATVARHTDGLHLLAWDDPDRALLEAVARWRHDDGVTTADLRWLVDVHADGPAPDRRTLLADGSLGAAVDVGGREVQVDAGGVYRLGNRLRNADGSTDAWR